MRRVFAFAFVMLAAPLAAARADTSDRFSKGGWYENFAPAIARANASGELFRIRGHCQSNCTLFLGVRNVCVERGARLLFHAGHGRGVNRNTINQGSTQRMLDAYNPKLRQYVLAKGYMDKLEFSAISGARIIDEFGYKECPKR
ncbi:hypothetical protein AFIC_002431 [[Pseudomonas] carboxydohydrogena]|uniref:Uncharacterized protein n=1 Tax=Afipia carboxydohydrogena TaxID=290 RepID=A0ABY8BMZ6_AFICR|nr:hypothetical protein [[Pseudomonas] carboxydohydrogena]WEF50876.1 hypothetical protein AFIC_002431 [[Pseudomonas] carboxydohydrogena]